MPTLRDRRFASRMRRMVVHWFEQPQNAALREDALLLSGTWTAFRERMLRDPTYDASGRCTRQGGWSGTACSGGFSFLWANADEKLVQITRTVKSASRLSFGEARKSSTQLENVHPRRFS